MDGAEILSPDHAYTPQNKKRPVTPGEVNDVDDEEIIEGFTETFGTGNTKFSHGTQNDKTSMRARHSTSSFQPQHSTSTKEVSVARPSSSPTRKASVVTGPSSASGARSTRPPSEKPSSPVRASSGSNNGGDARHHPRASVRQSKSQHTPPSSHSRPSSSSTPGLGVGIAVNSQDLDGSAYESVDGEAAMHDDAASDTADQPASFTWEPSESTPSRRPVSAKTPIANPFQDEEASAYLSRTVFPTLMPAIERVLGSVKSGEEVADPIGAIAYHLAKHNPYTAVVGQRSKYLETVLQRIDDRMSVRPGSSFRGSLARTRSSSPSKRNSTNGSNSNSIAFSRSTTVGSLD